MHKKVNVKNVRLQIRNSTGIKHKIVIEMLEQGKVLAL